MSDQPPFIPLSPEPAPQQDAGPPAAGAPSPRGSGSWKSWVAAAVVAAVVAGGAGVLLSSQGSKKSGAATTGNPAAAADSNPGGGTGGFGGPGGFRGRGANGKVTKISGTTLTVERTANDGTTTTYTVETSSSTVFTDTTQGTASDLKVGDNVVVLGSSSGGAAQRVLDQGDQTIGQGRPQGAPRGAPQGGPPGGGGGRFGNATAGSITAVDGSTLTVKAADGTTSTVTLDGSTAITVTRRIHLSDIAVGDTVSARGTTKGSTVTATSVRKGTGGFGAGGPGGEGGPGGFGRRDDGGSTPTTAGA